MKARRILVTLCMLALLIAGMYSGERLYFIGFVMMASAVVLALVSVIFTGFTFKYLQSLTPPAGIKGETLEFSIEVHNDLPFPQPYIKLYYDNIDSLLEGKRASTMLSLMPRSHGQCTESIYCRYRGRWNIGIKQVEICDFFGLIRVRLDVTKFLSHKPITLLVRPRILIIDNLPLRRKNDEGLIETTPRRSDDIAMLSDIRKYRIGDQMKRIHWKLTARQREIMIKNYEETSLPDLLLYVDTHAKELPQTERLNLEDTLVESTTAVLHYLLQRYIPTSMIFYGDERVQLSGARPEHFQSFYSVLSEMPFNGRYPLEDVLMNDLKLVTHAGNLFLITWSLTDKLFDLLMMMNSSRLNITIAYVYGPAAGGETDVKQAVELGKIRRMISEMRNAGITVIDLKPGENFAERVSVLQ